MKEVALEQEQKQHVEYQLLEFQYSALKARLNPHFLYNVLDSISSLAKLRDEYDISEWICLLSDMLRESIGQKKHLVPLADELSYVRKYTALYEMMYQNRVSILYQTDPALDHLPVPTFILQPVVENAIVHGIEGRSGSSIIRIRSYEEEEKLILEVWDNGVGIPKDVIVSLLDGTPLSPEEPTSGNALHTKVGLSTIRERILLLYGADYGIHISSSPAQGTAVKIILPLNS